MLRIILPFLLSCNNELLFCLNTAYGKDFMAILTICKKRLIVFFSIFIFIILLVLTSSKIWCAWQTVLWRKCEKYHGTSGWNRYAQMHSEKQRKQNSKTLSWLLTRFRNKSSNIFFFSSFSFYPFCSHTKYRQVSWIRKRDIAILTSNTFVYTTDTRFSVIHIPDSNNWDLRVKQVSQKDCGTYECQINTEPKINFPIHLDVISK